MKGRLSKRCLALLVSGGLLAVTAFSVAAAGGFRLLKEAADGDTPPQTTFVFDDQDAVCTGSWTEELGSSPERYGPGFRYVFYGEPATATYTATVEQDGWYEISGWWTALSNRATNAPFTVTCGEQTVPVRVNQQERGGQWNHLQTVKAKAGDTITVTLTNDADQYVIADALKIAREEGVIVDDEDAVCTGGWTRQDLNETGESLERFGPTFRYASAVGDPASETALFEAEAPADGTYKVYAWWTSHQNRAQNTPYTLSSGETVRVNQEENGGRWNFIGTVEAKAGETLSATVGNNADEYVAADAVKFRLDDGVMDDNEAVLAGSWTMEAMDKADERYGEAFYYSAWLGEESEPTATAAYNTVAAEDGYYAISAWWTIDDNRSTVTPYTLTCGGQSQTVRVNQQQNGGKWNLLGGVQAEKGQAISIVIGNNANGFVIADAVKVEKIDPPEKYTITLTYDQQAGEITGKTADILAGETVTLTASPKENFAFEGWYEGETKICETPSYTFTMDGNKNLTVKFTAVIPKPDKSGLLAAIEGARASKTDGRYSGTLPSVQQEIDKTLKAAEATYANENADAAAIEADRKNLAAALEKLSLRAASKAELATAVDYAKGLDLKNYQSDGQSAFTAAIGKAEAALENKEAQQPLVDDALYELLHAAAALRLQSDKALLN